MNQKPPVPPGGFCFSSPRIEHGTLGRVSVDLQVVYPQEAIHVTGVAKVPGTSPTVYDVRGTDFTAVDEVLLNEVVAKDFAVMSRTRLLVTQPEGMTGLLESVAVTSRRLVMTERSILRFRIGSVPSKVSGILRLVQYFTKVLLTTPGTDIFNKRLGGAALRNIGRTFSKTETGGVVSDFVVAVENTSRQIIAIQGRQPTLPADERLLAAKVTTARFVAGDASLRVAVEVTSQAGRSAVANLTY